MEISPTSPAPTTDSAEVKIAMLQKRQLQRQQAQTEQLIDSAHSTPPADGGSEEKVGKYLNQKV